MQETINANQSSDDAMTEFDRMIKNKKQQKLIKQMYKEFSQKNKKKQLDVVQQMYKTFSQEKGRMKKRSAKTKKTGSDKKSRQRSSGGETEGSIGNMLWSHVCCRE